MPMDEEAFLSCPLLLVGTAPCGLVGLWVVTWSSMFWAPQSHLTILEQPYALTRPLTLFSLPHSQEDLYGQRLHL